MNDEERMMGTAEPFSFSWTITSVVDRNATTTAIEADFNGEQYVVTGSAKREKGDVWDPAIGLTLSLSRALSELSAELKTDGQALVQAAEQAKQERISRHIKRVERKVLNEPGQRQTLSITAIREKYGNEAAKRASERRTRTRWTPIGRDTFA